MEISQNLRRFGRLMERVNEMVESKPYQDSSELLENCCTGTQLLGDLMTFRTMVKNGTFPPHYEEMVGLLKERWKIVCDDYDGVLEYHREALE